MFFFSYTLEGNCKAELETEIRYNIASSKAEGTELVELRIKKTDDERNNSRLLTCLTKVLSSMKKDSLIQFYATPKGFETESTEAMFLQNKYPEYLKQDNDFSYIYVKNP